jgi:regulatory protein
MPDERRGPGRSEGSERPGPRITGGSPDGRADPAEQAREICLQLLAVRPRTRAELATALRKAGVADEVAAELLERYREVGMINDTAFARAWVTSRHHGRGLARRALAGELHRKGVETAAVGAALEELAPATEEDTARALVARRLRTERRDRPEATLRRLVGMLARKGYPPDLAVRVVRDALAADESTAEFASALDPDALADAVGDPEPSEFHGPTDPGRAAD